MLSCALAAQQLGREPTRLVSAEPGPAPIDSGDVVEVVAPRALGRGDVVVADADDACRLLRLVAPAGRDWLARDEPAGPCAKLPSAAILGVVTLVEKGDLVLELGRGRWRVLGRLLAALPPGAGRGIAVLALLERLRRPLFPPLFMGTSEELLAQLRAAHEPEVKVIGRREGLSSDEQALVGGPLVPGMTLLDVGCGVGREAIGFAHAGLAVTGLDLAPSMIELARARARAAGVSMTFEVGDPLTFFAETAPYDAIYLPSGIYSHIPGRTRRIATLRRLASLLPSGGVIILTPTWFEPFPLLSRARLVDALRRVGRRCGLTRLSEPGDGYHRGNAVVRAPASFRYVHRFAGEAELVAEVDAAGLTVTARPSGTPFWILAPRVRQ